MLLAQRATNIGVLYNEWQADQMVGLLFFCSIDFKGADLSYLKRRSPRDSTRGTALGVLLFRWGEDALYKS